VALLHLAVGLGTVAAKEFKPPEELGPDEFDNKIIEHFLGSGQKGILTAFKGTPEMRGTDLQLSYWLKENSPFKAEYLVINATDNPLNLTILCLIDYHQQAFRLNDQMASLHPVKINPGERAIAVVELPPLREGAHDFILLAIENPVEFSPETEHQILSHRANLFVGDITFPSVNYLPLGVQSTIARKATYTTVINLHNDYSHFEPLRTDYLDIDRVKRYFVHINNAYDTPMRSVFVTFLNGKQIPINHETGQEVLYWNIAAKRQDMISLVLKAPNCQIACELLVLSIDNPYIEVEPERGVMAQLPTRIRAANRLTIYPGGTTH